MKIKILANKFYTGSIVLRINNYVIKIPFTKYNFHEFKVEKEKILQVKSDNHFSNYLPNYKYLFDMPILPCFNDFIYELHKDEINKYFLKAFNNNKIWEKVLFLKIIDTKILYDFVKNYNYKYFEIIKYFCEKAIIPKSSTHGDFHPANIMLSDNKLLFLDWSRYNKNSSRFFDLIDFNVFLKKDVSESWTSNWKNLIKKKTIIMNNIGVDKKYLYCYALWKIAEEICILRQRRSFKQKKIQKYQNFIENFISILSNDQDILWY